jgi:hypothetical protein
VKVRGDDMDREEFVLMLIVMAFIVILCLILWAAGQDTMATEICQDAGYVIGSYSKPIITCYGETELFIQTTTDKETP